ncbi:GNAT family N-acetyltransferase [Paraflavitalea sp. CAU 1676]|uniref:GNAT family N-acetyltransferase n=1 Tax=Paraflavitalea sp. CAU 1676 TaxID=3032598 RepID=UPI0023DA46D4|nr:GNAT family N-acetyltransferase [Paraflavitalea sp. CAU 1676]MDF2190243.1 GNAT family N-acetyltransferase [Paraflavitalea sp. CAU 1676]
MISIRIAEETDLPEILTIYNDIIVNTTAVYDYNAHTPAMRKQWWDTKVQQGFPVFVAVEDGKVVGFSSIGPFRAWAAYKYSVENSIYVAADQRGKGIGKLLMPPLIEAARQLNMHTILAGIDASNDASVKLHESFGFKEVALFREVGYKFGKWLDLKFLQLVLETPANPIEQ